MNNIKVNLAVTLPGRVMVSKQECLKNPQENNNIHFTSVQDKDGKYHSIRYTTRKCRPAYQSLNLSQEAYECMVSPLEIPEWATSIAKKHNLFVKTFWTHLSKKARLELHLDRIRQSLGGTSFTYKIFDD